ncbi:MAG: ribosome recycling factor [Bacteroidota bacterium]|nr:ribosome recycling factor [Bacteroidota bacterium]
MNELIKPLVDGMNAAMEKCLSHTEHEFSRIRAGKATPNMLDMVHAEVYGMNMPLNQVATVSTSDARTLVITPFDKTSIGPIERGITDANLGFNPTNDGHVIRILVPALTEDRRRDLVKNVKAAAEHARVTIRNERKDYNERIRKLKADGMSEDDMKGGEEKIQQITNATIAKVDSVMAAKEKDIMTV